VRVKMHDNLTPPTDGVEVSTIVATPEFEEEE
jgi:hypothetical protein